MYVTDSDRAKIHEISEICVQNNILPGFSLNDYSMLLIACHANNNKLDLGRLKLASLEALAKDICGINDSINVDTLKLEGFFPRTTKMTRNTILPNQTK